ncbi:MAG: hypothetical protein ACJAZ0_001322 [Halioglobus sp.]|jgi:hypothetical protein
MELTSLQAYDIEKALVKGRTIDAIKLYREGTGCDLRTAKTEIDKRLAALKTQKPHYFNDLSPTHAEPAKPKISKAFLVKFLLIDALIFGGLIYYFFLSDNSSPAPRDANQSAQYEQKLPTSKGRPKSASLPSHVDTSTYTTTLSPEDSFDSLYNTKLSNTAYIRHKSSPNSSSYDSSNIERKIKTARSQLAMQRTAPIGTSPVTIKQSDRQATLDGVIDSDEWTDATRIVVNEESNTTLYLKTDGQWLFIACDTPQEKSPQGYDQLRVYFHAGLNPNLVNERIHIGRASGVTSIRQTNFRWTGSPPENNDERWKKYAISDWGIYKHAYGTSSMSSGHRQYEAAIYLGEAGLHPGVPFTLYAEVETDPLKNDQGKFVERQYLGELGGQQNPVWMVF